MNIKENFSYSKINTFYNCERKYEFIYKKKYPKSNNVSSLKGTLLHKMIELYIQDLDYNIKYEGDFTQLPEKEFNLFKEEFEKNIKHQNIIKSLKSMYGKQEALEMENKISNIFNNFVFSGTADTFVKNNNKIIIIDYKTGKPFRNFEQLEYYAYIYSLIYPEVKEYMLILSYVMYNKEEVLKISKDDLDKIKTNLIDKIDNINNTNIYNKNISKLCEYCEYKKECMIKDQLDLIYTDIIESKDLLPAKIKGPLVWDGYVKSDMMIVTSDLSINDYDNNKIFSGDERIYISNILEEYNIKLNELFILNYDMFVDKNGKQLAKKYNEINKNQFNNIMNIINPKIIIIFGKNTYNKLTNRNNFKHDTKIEYNGKTLFMFEDANYIINNFEKNFTYNLLTELKEKI